MLKTLTASQDASTDGSSSREVEADPQSHLQIPDRGLEFSGPDLQHLRQIRFRKRSGTPATEGIRDQVFTDHLARQVFGTEKSQIL